MTIEQLALLLSIATACASLKTAGHLREADMYKFRLAQALRSAGFDPDEVMDAMVKHFEDPRL